MTYEYICSGGSSKESKEYNLAEINIMRGVILSTCGDPPNGCQLEIRFQDHDYGGFYELGLSWEMNDEEWLSFHDYLDKAIQCYTALNDNLDWDSLWNAFPSEWWKIQINEKEL